MKATVLLSVGLLSLCASNTFADNLNITFRDGSRQTVQLNQPSVNIKTLDLGENSNLLSGGGTYVESLTGVHSLKARHSGKCLDVSGVETRNGANVQQWQCHGGKNQKWRFTSKGNGYYTLTAVHSGRCLDVSGIGRNNGDNVQQWDCHGGANQIWKVTAEGDGSYRLSAKHSGKCLDVAGIGISDGTNIQQWDCHGGDNQKWLIE